MPVRSSMSQIISRVRLMIQDPAGASQFFADQDIQDTLDDHREDVRYELLKIAPSIINLPSTNNQAAVAFTDYYSSFSWWESDVVIQGINTSTGAAWAVLSPAGSDYIVGRFQFELTPFVNGVAPSQYPPVFATGKTFDVFAASADLLEFWAANLASAYDITVDGQTLRRSQLMQAKMMLAQSYRRKAKPRIGKMVRSDLRPDVAARKLRLLDSDDTVKGL